MGINFTTRVKHSVIDPYSSGFLNEGELYTPDWNEGWINFLRFFRDNALAQVLARFEYHYEFCSLQQNFKLNFRAILRLTLRSGASTYLRNWEAARAQVLSEAVRNFMEWGGASVVRTSFVLGKHSAEPYTRESSSFRTPASRPFPRGGEVTAGTPICLICARTGHKFYDCSYSLSEAGETGVGQIHRLESRRWRNRKAYLYLLEPLRSIALR
ncbi:hypothetical protein HYPSUDRAFT_758398 [Hypholoma sublateritium FD-334 SS-4]|uniref:Uncharacterized protein n=1 Tax=Hypholoma sublateritium (strain FD-334 SS-4) TaxID=945553 RepID=A0A0D2L2T5_HYPSF|nr:hypothetical protein HYPSUDRAFT_758398 [Hypholoma sublateritium FD-334 SS-4]